jgi:EAL domain-containing protein (putative c-di-GMP-specific phosphodiesterase class I)/DNA-binding NarL/FixJ family response regulator
VRALVVDDDLFARELLTAQLTQLGVEDVQTCDSGLAALERLGKRHANFDTLLCDLNMPGMDGIEFLRYLAQQRYRGDLLFVSVAEERTLQSAVTLAKEYGLSALGALRKPVDIAELRRFLELRQFLEVLPALTRNSFPQTVRRAYGAARIREAISRGELVNHYQPQVAFAGRTVVGAEALVRWQHPIDGLVFPSAFIADAEASALIGPLTRCVLENALADARRWRDEGMNLRLAINVSVLDLEDLDFPDRLAREADRAGIPPEQLVLEVTERQAMHDRATLLDVATRLRLRRIGLSLDDFGTGYSSLAQLRDIPFREMKLDRGFVRGASNDASLQAIVEASLRMAKHFEMRTVAEGVEDRDDWDCLNALGCDVAQGYFIARPMTAAEVPRWVRAWSAGQLALQVCA